MTYVLACLTRNIVYQVSDRRLTTIEPPYKLFDDESNKAVVVNGRISFAYTGLAAVEGIRTDLWLARVIGEGATNNMREVAERIQARATMAFSRLNVPTQSKRHAFQGVGFFRLLGESQDTPGVITIDNAIDKESGEWLKEALPTFQIKTHFQRLFPGKCFLTSVGVMPSQPERRAILRHVLRPLKHRNATDRAVTHALANAVRWISTRHSAVGAGMMAIKLMKDRIDAADQSGNYSMRAGEDFVYISASGHTRVFGPNLVFGRMVMAGFEGGSLTP
jgi:hypothetical protein